jgi:hypothetical protein
MTKSIDSHPIDDYRRLIAEREARFQVLDEIRRRMPELPVKEVERDVTEAIAALRRTTKAAGATSRP